MVSLIPAETILGCAWLDAFQSQLTIIGVTRASNMAKSVQDRTREADLDSRSCRIRVSNFIASSTCAHPSSEHQLPRKLHREREGDG